MTSKIVMAGGLLIAFVAGVLFQGYSLRGTSQAFNPPNEAAYFAPVQTVRSIRRAEPLAQPATYPVVQRQVVYEEVPRAQRGRSWEREVLIVAGSSGAGAAIGAAAGGKKGAVVGAISGGVAGLIYDIATRNK